MNIAKLSIERPLNTWLIVVICLLGGIWGFNTVGKLEDPAFTIPNAIINTPYPGATAVEVEEEVTEAQPVASSSALQPTPAAVSGGSVPATSASQVNLSYYTASVRSRTHTADMSYATAEDHTDGNTETDASVRNSHSRGPSVS